MKKNLLNEELKKFRQLVEYDFHLDAPLEEADDENLDDMGAEPTDGDMGDEMPAEEPMGAEEEMPTDDANDFSGEEPTGDMGGEMPAEEPMDMNNGEDEVELDVTQLVQGTEDAKASSDRANQQIDQLIGKFDELTQKLNHMSSISTKIDGLEREMEKRMPTDKEKLELRSLDSYPYSQKLSDYWFDKEGIYDVMGNEEGGEKKPEEYVLTQDKVDSDYNDRNVRDSFNADEYEEEDIY